MPKTKTNSDTDGSTDTGGGPWAKQPHVQLFIIHEDYIKDHLDPLCTLYVAA